MAYVYITTNILNDKKYIGVVASNKPKNNYLGSGVILQHAIKKYGKENFTKKIIKHFNDPIEARDYEKKLIRETNAIKDKQYYNLVEGG